jgi:hypothetical protein
MIPFLDLYVLSHSRHRYTPAAGFTALFAEVFEGSFEGVFTGAFAGAFAPFVCFKVNFFIVSATSDFILGFRTTGFFSIFVFFWEVKYVFRGKKLIITRTVRAPSAPSTEVSIFFLLFQRLTVGFDLFPLPNARV